LILLLYDQTPMKKMKFKSIWIFFEEVFKRTTKP
jgi:hypothetical protein